MYTHLHLPIYNICMSVYTHTYTHTHTHIHMPACIHTYTRIPAEQEATRKERSTQRRGENPRLTGHRAQVSGEDRGRSVCAACPLELCDAHPEQVSEDGDAIPLITAVATANPAGERWVISLTFPGPRLQCARILETVAVCACVCVHVRVRECTYVGCGVGCGRGGCCG